MNALFTNSVTLRGFLAKDAQVPTHVDDDALTILLLATVSGVWNLGNNEWIPRTDWHRVICLGAYFCGLLRGMRHGEYLEVEGELRALEQERGVVVAGERFPVKHSTYAVHAIRIQRLDRPEALVDYGEDG